MGNNNQNTNKGTTTIMSNDNNTNGINNVNNEEENIIDPVIEAEAVYNLNNTLTGYQVAELARQLLAKQGFASLTVYDAITYPYIKGGLLKTVTINGKKRVPFADAMRWAVKYTNGRIAKETGASEENTSNANLLERVAEELNEELS